MQQFKHKICHITTVHTRYDVRIFHKECKSLSKKYDVNLIVADGLGDETVDNIKIHDIGLRQASRLKRAKIDSAKALKKALELDCELYHFHDPELTRIGVKLKKAGKKVIYDTHEDLPRQIYGKPYIKPYLKPIIARFVEWQENKAAKQFDYICAATPFIRDRFLKINKNSIDINNFPIIDEISEITDFNKKDDAICYVGGLSQYRGVYELVESLKFSKIKLNIAGEFESKEFEQKCKQSEGWKYVNFYGFVSRKEVAEILQKSKIGMVTLPPLINYLDSLPIKMFEYMLAGIPVIASNFEYWETIINKNNCGKTVNPQDSKAIAELTLKMIENTNELKQMGENGRKAVLEKYNWSIEEKKLLEVYDKLL